MMMCAGFCIGMDRHRPGPNLLRADASEVDRGLSVHAGGLRGVRVKRASRDHAHAVVFPIFGNVARRHSFRSLYPRISSAFLLTLRRGPGAAVLKR